VPFTYLGRLSEDNRTTAFLASGERNLVVKPGDVIDNNYRVDEVTDRMVQLTYLPLNVKQTVSTGAQ
jgi:Tfp pilus assembly protein PilP